MDEDTSIAVVSTTCLQVPPEGYGGLELMVYHLASELAERSYDVTVIAPEGTEVEGVDVIETTPPSDSEQCFAKEPLAYRRYADRLGEFDVVIDHSWQKLSYRRAVERPDETADTTFLGVFHGMPTYMPLPVERPNLLAVSRAAAAGWTDRLDHEVRHVHNGIDPSRYPLQREKGDYVMTLNRVSAEKGILQCVELADEVGVHTKIVGEDVFVDDLNYVVETMARCGSSQFAEYVGAVDHDRKVELLRNARALLLLPQPPYREAFGLAAAEAMACGTPVLATDNAGLGEVVETVQGTGAYDNLDVLAADLERLFLQSGRSPFPGPEELRAGVEEHFSVDRMTDWYVQRAEEAIEDSW